MNGKLEAEGPGGTTPEKWDERRMGSEYDGRWLIGKIDEVRVYNRVLTEKEIANNYIVKSNKLATCWGVIKKNSIGY